MEKIAIASDHAGYEYKEIVKSYLKDLGYDYEDFGTDSKNPVDYPDYAHTVSKKIKQGVFKRGILICGTGIGMSLAANRHSGIRAAVCESVEAAKYSRLHNDANILCLGARITPIEKIKEIVKVFLETEFEDGRHTQRINKIENINGE